MMARLIRPAGGLLIALLVAALLNFMLFDLGAPGGESFIALMMRSIGRVFAYGLPLAVIAVGATEFLRVRHAAVYPAIGAALCLIAARLFSSGEALTSPVYSSGALTSLSLVAVGALSGLAYWAAAGRRAGWRGDDVERAEAFAAQAFSRASANASVERCRECLLGWSAAGAVLFLLFGWISIDVLGLRDGFIAEAEAEGQAALKKSGYEWARFTVDDSRGVIEGAAPDEAQKFAAYESVREALGSVTGFPGVLSRIENRAVARMPMAEVSQQLEDAARRESEAKAAVEEARVAAETARAGEAEANRRAEQQARAAEEAARREKTAPPANPVEVEVAAVEPPQIDDTAPDVSNEVNSGSPAPEPSVQPTASSCTPQDLAMIESSRILFANQRFDLVSYYNGELDRLAASARACAPQAILVSGHADAGGDSVFNSALGLQRAEAVRAGLVARGVAPTLVVAKSSPADADSSGNDRAFNRRTEFRLLEASEISRDATLGPEERAAACESELAEIMAQSIIHFPTGSSRISEQSMGLIRKLASSTQSCGSVIVTVEGHTDKIGDPITNQRLSEARANAVREALVVNGADPTRLASRGFSSSRPYDVAETVEAFALNRRIEFRVSGKFTSTSTSGP